MKEYTAQIILTVEVQTLSEEHAQRLLENYCSWLQYWTDYQYWYDGSTEGMDEDAVPVLQTLWAEQHLEREQHE